MTLWRDFDCEMQRLPLDVDTADRLLAGSVLRADAPPGYESVAALLDGLRAQNEDRLFLLEDAVPALDGGRSSFLETSSRTRRSRLHRLKLAGAAVTAALACTAGLAFAGSLPSAAQDVASSMLAKVGVTVPGHDDTVPGHDDSAGTRPEIRGTSSSDTAVDARTDKTEAESQGKGSEISGLATTTELTGVEKGAAISSLASGGKSQAGQHGKATAEHGPSSDAATSGADTAATASGGRSSGGADNAAAGQSHRP
jgi:hypothetical protein